MTIFLTRVVPHHSKSIAAGDVAPSAPGPLPPLSPALTRARMPGAISGIAGAVQPISPESI
ncbi:MAG: hypothetical protein ABIT83_25190 [Massilia sp.]